MKKRYDRDLFFVGLVVLASLKAILTRYLALGSAAVFPAVLLEIALIIVFLGAIDLVPPKRRASVDLFAYSLLSLIMLANVLYASYFDQIVDPSSLVVVSQLAAVREAVGDLLKIGHLLFLIDLPFLALWAFNLSAPGRNLPGRSQGVMVAVGLGVAFAIFQVVGISAIPSDVDSVSVARSRGFGAFQIASLVRGFGRAETADATGQGGSSGAKLQARIELVRQAANGPRIEGVEHGQYAGKNVILIQVEALQAPAFGASYRGQEITPNMNRMAEDSWMFVNAYSQTGAGNTSDAEFIVNTSLMPPPGKAASVVYADKEFPGLPRLLHENGYRTVTMHANDAEFWDRRNLYSALGFDKYYDKKDLGSADPLWKGSSDEMFFEQAEDAFDGELQGDKPVYAQFVTLSSHQPFRYVPDNREPLKIPKEMRGTRAADWLASLSYADLAVGQFLDWLKMTGIYDDSIVILYGDHVAMKDVRLTGTDKEIMEEILGREYSAADLQWIPLLVHLPGQSTPEVVTSPAGQVDIMPTVADLLGVELTKTPHLGRSLFVDSNPLVLMRSYYPGGSFINAETLFMPQLSFDDGSAIRLADRSPAEPSEVDRKDFERARKLSALSEEWADSLPKRNATQLHETGYIPIPIQQPEGE